MRKFHRVILGATEHVVSEIRADGRPFDSRVFSETARPLEVGRLTGFAPGPLATDAGWSNDLALIANQEVRDVIESISPGSVQWIEIAVEGTAERRFILQTLHEFECLDESRIDGMRSKRRPGSWGALIRIYLDPAFDPGEHHIFRISRYEMAMLMTDELKSALDAEGFTGFSYIPVEE